MQEHLRRRLTTLALLALAAVGCGTATSDDARSGSASASSAGSGGGKLSRESLGAMFDGFRKTIVANVDSLRPARRAHPVRSDSIGMLADVPGLTLAADCPAPGPDAAAEMAAQAAARIPIKVGLTLSHAWKADASSDEHECLAQVTAVDLGGIEVSSSCTGEAADRYDRTTRRVCRSDLERSAIYMTETSRRLPHALRGTLQFSLSAASLAALKRDGRTRHRFLNMQGRRDRLLVLDHDMDGVLASQGRGTYRIAVNDTVVTLPTVEARHRNDAKDELIAVKVLDDPQVPIVLDYGMPNYDFFVTQTKISFPTEHGLERRLAEDRRVDVYGIYFDFASDSLRVESAPVLREIGAALAAHRDWKLTITGHTDSIGGAASNLDLSRRRSARVRRALVEQYGVDGARLTTGGYGSGQPKDVNTTPEGRARNRRVELVRY